LYKSLFSADTFDACLESQMFHQNDQVELEILFTRRPLALTLVLIPWELDRSSADLSQADNVDLQPPKMRKVGCLMKYLMRHSRRQCCPRRPTRRNSRARKGKNIRVRVRKGEEEPDADFVPHPKQDRRRIVFRGTTNVDAMGIELNLISRCDWRTTVFPAVYLLNNPPPFPPTTFCYDDASGNGAWVSHEQRGSSQNRRLRMMDGIRSTTKTQSPPLLITTLSSFLIPRQTNHSHPHPHPHPHPWLRYPDFIPQLPSCQTLWNNSRPLAP
jgi:hypothetical protein